MSANDRLKEQIAYLKLWLGTLVVTGISIGGWLVSNWDEATWPLLMGAAVGLFSIAGGAGFLTYLAIDAARRA